MTDPTKTPPAGNWATEQLATLDRGWRRLMAVVEQLGPPGLARPLTPAWTIKEMLAHLAFWDETSVPVIQTMYRGGPEVPVEQWYGGTDLNLKPGEPWPDADTHNAREARWARPRGGDEVLRRLARAREKLKAVLATVTDEEARGPIGKQWSGDAVCQHVDHHMAQVAALNATSPPAAEHARPA